jgi:multiple sugar transport system permease protein
MRETLATRLALIAPTQGLVLAVLVLPALYLVWLSLHTSSFGIDARWVGLDNYRHILADGYFWRSLKNTALIVLVVVHVELLLGLLMALLFASGLPMRRVMLAVVLAPYAVSEVAAVVMWRYLFDPEVGHVAYLLAAVGLPALDWAVNPLHGMVLVALLSVWLHLPFTFMILYAARLAVPTELYEAARIDGATEFQVLRDVTIPALLPVLAVVAILKTVFALKMFDQVVTLTGGGPGQSTVTLAYLVYSIAFRWYDMGYASAVAWILTALLVFLAIWYMKLILRKPGGA